MRLSVGLIGYGMAGRVFHAPLIRATPMLDLTAIVTSRRQDVAALDPKIACLTDADMLLADPSIDLIVIATPSATHADMAARALQAGKHVVVDKPFALTLADARALAKMADDAGRQLAVFHNRRFDSDFISIRSMIAAGAIGRVTHFESHFDRFRPDVRDRWREDGSPGSGVWFDLGPHLVDQALALFGRPQSVNADIAALRAGSAADDWAHVVLHYDGLRVVLHAGLTMPGGEAGGAPRFAVHGTAGTIIKRLMDPQEAQLVAGLRPGDPAWGVDPDPVEHHDGAGQVRHVPAQSGCQHLFYLQVADALIGRGALPVPTMEAVAVQEVVEAARLSAQEGRVIQLPLP